VALGDIVQLTDVRYLDSSALQGRFISTLTFYEETWRLWLPLEEGKFVEISGFPAEALYFAREPELKTDIYSSFLTFMAQRANFVGLEKPFSGISDDFFNLSASLAKLDLIFEAGPQNGSHRMAATEVEYLLLVCRSVFDLLQEIISKL